MIKRLGRRHFLVTSGGLAAVAMQVACNQQALEVPTPKPSGGAAPAPTAAAPAAAPSPQAGAQAAPAATTPAPAPSGATPAAAAAAAAKPAEPTKPAAAPASQPTPPPAVDIKFGQIAELPRGETLIISVSDTINQMTDSAIFNPFLQGSLRTGWHFAFEPLFFYNPWWTPEVNGPPWAPAGKEGEIPYLATSYDYRNNYQEILIKLRPQVTWSDGKPFTANDVVFTINMMRDNAPKLTFSFDVQRRVKDVVAENEGTVRIALTAPDPSFMFDYFMWHQDAGFPIVAEHVFKGQDPLTFTHLDPAKGFPVTTGPWKIVQSSPEQKIYDRRDDWWGARTGFRRLPAPKRIVLLPHFEDPKLTQLLSAGQVDATHNLQPPDTEVALQRNPKLKLRKVDNSKPYGWLDWWPTALGFNDAREPWTDPEVRWAVNHAIDRKQIVDIGFKGDTQPNVLPFPAYQPMLKYYDAVKDVLEKSPIDKFDPGKTAQIMGAKGYTKDGEGLFVKDGKRLEMVIIHAPGFFQSFLPVLVTQLRKAGFDASFKSPSNAGTLMSTGEIDAFLDGHSGALRDPYLTLNHYHGRYYKPTGEPTERRHRWRNPEYDRLVDELAKTTPSDPNHMSLYHKAMEIWIPNLPDIPLIQWYLIMPVNQTHWKGWPDEKTPYAAPSLWHRGSATLVINSLEPAYRTVRADYLARRVLQFLVVLWGAATLNFLLPRLSPGNPVRERLMSALNQGGLQQSGIEEMVRAYNQQFGLDQPLWYQYLIYLWNALHLDFGYSIAEYPARVLPMIMRALPWTIGLLAVSTLLSFAVGTLLGALIAWPRAPRTFRYLMGPMMALSSIPYYLLGLILVYVLGVVLPIFPLSGGYSIGTIPRLSLASALDVVHHAALPALAIVLVGVGFWSLGMRGMMVTTAGEDYMNFADAKGLRDRRIFLRYAVRNAILPQVTSLAINLGTVVSGSVVVEVVFGYPGIGSLLFKAINGLDYFVIYGIVFMTVLAIASATLLIDLLYPILDPRISYRGG